MRLKNLNKKLSEVIYNYWNDVVTNIERPSMEWIESMMSDTSFRKGVRSYSQYMGVKSGCRPEK